MLELLIGFAEAETNERPRRIAACVKGTDLRSTGMHYRTPADGANVMAYGPLQNLHISPLSGGTPGLL